MPMTAPDLLDLGQDEIDALWRGLQPGPVPDGSGTGTVLVAAGTILSDEAATIAHVVAWKDKTFDAARGELVDEAAPFAHKAAPARVYVGESWSDHRPAIVLDYSETGILARHVRDELREVAAGLYLGVSYWEQAQVLNFSLQFDQET